MSLHIGIDGNEANVVRRVGSNRYAYGIISALYDNLSHDRYTVYLKHQPVADMPPAKDGWQYRVIRPQKLWTQWRLPLELYLSRSRPQVFFSPGHYAPRFAPMPVVVSIMDLAFIKYPALFTKHKRGVAQLSQWTAYSVAQSAHVIAISNHTRQDVQDIYHLDPGRITVAYPGIDLTHFSPQPSSLVNSVRQKYRLPPDYLLYVGTLQPRKNLTRVLRAFESLPRTYKKLAWVIVGQKGWKYQNFLHNLTRSACRHRIISIGYIDDQDLPALYTGAKATLLVGLYEGFGLPAAESLACGTLPIISDASALPEVTGPAGICVNPFSAASIKNGILYTLKLKTPAYAKRVKLGQAHIKQFNWHLSARTIRKVLHGLAV